MFSAESISFVSCERAIQDLLCANLYCFCFRVLVYTQNENRIHKNESTNTGNKSLTIVKIRNADSRLPFQKYLNLFIIKLTHNVGS